MLDDENLTIIRLLAQAADARIDAIERRFDDLRQTDRDAVRLAHQDLSERLKGFPQMFATRDEMVGANEALQRLEKNSVSREVYESRHEVMAELVNRLDREKMPEAVFQAFVDDYRIEQETAAVERRAVASALAAGTERQAGSQATWKQIAAVVIFAVTVLTFVIILANYFLHR